MKEKTKTKQLRSFGLLVGSIFVAIGAWPLLMGQPLRWWALGLGSVLIILGSVVPASLALPYKGWMAVGHVLGWINTRIILGIVFYGLVTPLGLIRRAMGKDPLHVAYDPRLDTYRVPKSPRAANHLKHQF